MQRPAKELQVIDLKEKFKNSKVVLVADYATVTVKEATKLRDQLKSVQAGFKVAKNTLTEIAITGTEYEGLKDYLKGQVVLTFAQGPVEASKILVKFGKDTGKLKLKAAFFEGQVVGPEIIKEMAALPSKEELLAKLVGGIKAPIFNLVFVLSGIYRKFLYALSEIQNQKGKVG